VKLLLEKGYKVHATVRDPNNPAKVEHLKSLPKAATNLVLFKADLMEEGVFDNVFAGCHGVFHLASPCFFQAEDPEKEIIEPAVFGTLNVLKSCEKTGVKVVVQCSSMFAAYPKPMPAVLSEKHWSDPEEQKKEGNFYGASKTLAERAAVEFLAKMPVETAFRLVRICPTLVTGPMLQPSTNLSMGYFAGFVTGAVHEEILNDSMEFIDVRDCAAHHVNAYEGDHEGRFFSLTESWPWTVVYAALKHFNPEMKCPKPLPEGTKPAKAKQIDFTRMKSLGVDERSVIQTLGDGVEACRERGLLKANE
jgi:nucleoside-diphosphate-sugar epimerase